MGKQSVALQKKRLCADRRTKKLSEGSLRGKELQYRKDGKSTLGWRIGIVYNLSPHIHPVT